jgi:hypothetical protein
VTARLRDMIAGASGRAGRHEVARVAGSSGRVDALRRSRRRAGTQ